MTPHIISILAYCVKIFFRQYTARVMSESIDELETELETQEDNTLTANRFRELMDTLDVDEGAQELAVAILKEEGVQAVQVQELGGM